MNAFSSPQAVLFDLDGTLVDASAAICHAFRQALKITGAAVTDEQVRLVIGRPLRDMFLSVVPSARSSELDALVTRYRSCFFPLADTMTIPLPGASQLVARLTGKVRLGLVTTRSSDGAIRILRAKGMLVSFDCIVGLNHVTRPKPAPEPVLTALSLLGVRADSAVMVGDTPDDIAAGRTAGTRTVGVTTGSFCRRSLEEAGADVVVESLEELEAILTFRDAPPATPAE